MKAILQLFTPVAEKTGKGVDEYLKPLMSPPMEFSYAELLAVSVALGIARQRMPSLSGNSGADKAQQKIEAVMAVWKKYVKENS